MKKINIFLQDEKHVKSMSSLSHRIGLTLLEFLKAGVIKRYLKKDKLEKKASMRDQLFHPSFFPTSAIVPT